VRLLNVRKGVSTEARTEYWVRVDDRVEELPLAVSLVAGGLRLWDRDRLAKAVGSRAAALITRTVELHDMGEALDLPTEITND